MGWDDNGLPTERQSAELLRRSMRSVVAVRSRLSAAGPAAEAAHLDLAAEFHRALRPADQGRRKGVRASVALSRSVRRLVDDLRHHRQAIAARFAGRISSPAQERPRLPTGSPDIVGHRLSNRGRASGARRSRARGRLSSAALRSAGRRRRGNRDHPPRIAASLCGARRAPGRRTIPAAVRQARADAAVPLARAGAGPCPGRSRKRERHRDDLHLRRPHRRDLVAGAVAAGSRRDSVERHDTADRVGRAGLGDPGAGSRADAPTIRLRACRSPRLVPASSSCCASRGR